DGVADCELVGVGDCDRAGVADRRTDILNPGKAAEDAIAATTDRTDRPALVDRGIGIDRVLVIARRADEAAREAEVADTDGASRPRVGDDPKLVVLGQPVVAVAVEAAGRAIVVPGAIASYETAGLAVVSGLDRAGRKGVRDLAAVVADEAAHLEECDAG